MKQKFLLFFSFVLLFAIEKPLFMLYHLNIYKDYSLATWGEVIWHGLPLDLTVAGYVCALPLVLSLVHVWIPGAWHNKLMRIYLRIIMVPLLLFFIVDLELYTHWGFRLDSTPLIYLTDNPLEALAQSPTWALFVFPLLILGLWYVLQRLFCHLFPDSATDNKASAIQAWKLKGILKQLGIVAVGIALFIVIRGGVTTSTMNVGHAYFSKDMKLNHAAINPTFSLLASLSKNPDFAKQYRFMSDAEVQQALLTLNEAGTPSDSLQTDGLDADMTSAPLLNTQRPNIVVIILESFSGGACNALYPEADPDYMPTINRMYREGIGFTNFYANSFRTDRGCACILASYPGQPTNSIMKQPQKSQNLQFMTRNLSEKGYDLMFIHGGDTNFTNMRSFLMAGSIEKVISDVDFPISDRLSKWGVPDHKMFSYLEQQVVEQSERQAVARQSDPTSVDAAPFMKVFLSLSSHEPFDVPYHHFADPYLNSVAYADSCLGSFIDALKATPAWDNLLIIGLPDHCFANYPEGIMTHETERYHIPMFWTGGTIEGPRIIDTYGSQIDLGATLLGQLGIDHQDFNFSKDLMNDSIGHYAFYAWPDGFGFLNDSLCYIQDNANNGAPLSGSNDPQHLGEKWGKAYLQNLYDDLSKR